MFSSTRHSGLTRCITIIWRVQNGQNHKWPGPISSPPLLSPGRQIYPRMGHYLPSLRPIPRRRNTFASQMTTYDTSVPSLRSGVGTDNHMSLLTRINIGSMENLQKCGGIGGGIWLQSTMETLPVAVSKDLRRVGRQESDARSAVEGRLLATSDSEIFQYRHVGYKYRLWYIYEASGLNSVAGILMESNIVMVVFPRAACTK